MWYLDGIDLTSASLLTPSDPGANWRVASAGDFNKDDKDDLVLQNTDGWLAVWFMKGTVLRDGRYLESRNPGGTWKVAGPN